jgi:hypothetical protein
MVQCYIQRRKSGMVARARLEPARPLPALLALVLSSRSSSTRVSFAPRQARLFPTYEIYLKDGDQFLLAARKRKKNKSSNYLISLDKDDLARQSGNFFGKLRSNFLGTEFSLYDKGVNPDKLEHMSRETVQLRQELGTILYKQNVLGSRGPRKMKVMVPNVNEAGQRKILRPQSAEETMLERYKAAGTRLDRTPPRARLRPRARARRSRRCLSAPLERRFLVATAVF